MIVGSLGPVIFQVDHQHINTFKDLSRKRTVKNAKHDVLEGLPRLQHTGRDLDAITLTVVLERMRNYDHNPDTNIAALLALAAAGEEVPLVLGANYFSLWFLETVDVSHKMYHRGLTWRATVNLSLVEYN